jgi:hypothetical protein
MLFQVIHIAFFKRGEGCLGIGGIKFREIGESAAITLTIRAMTGCAGGVGGFAFRHIADHTDGNRNGRRSSWSRCLSCRGNGGCCACGLGGCGRLCILTFKGGTVNHADKRADQIINRSEQNNSGNKADKLRIGISLRGITNGHRNLRTSKKLNH